MNKTQLLPPKGLRSKIHPFTCQIFTEFLECAREIVLVIKSEIRDRKSGGGNILSVLPLSDCRLTSDHTPPLHGHHGSKARSVLC